MQHFAVTLFCFLCLFGLWSECLAQNGRQKTNKSKSSKVLSKVLTVTAKPHSKVLKTVRSSSVGAPKATLRMYSVRHPMSWSASEQLDKFDFPLDASEFQFIPNESNDFGFAFDRDSGPGPTPESTMPKSVPGLGHQENFPSPKQDEDDYDEDRGSSRKRSFAKSSSKQSSSDDYENEGETSGRHGGSSSYSNKDEAMGSSSTEMNSGRTKDEDFNDEFFTDQSSSSAAIPSKKRQSKNSSRPTHAHRPSMRGDRESTQKRQFDYDMALEVDGDDSMRPTITINGGNRKNMATNDEDDEERGDYEAKPGSKRQQSSGRTRTQKQNRRKSNANQQHYND